MNYLVKKYKKNDKWHMIGGGKAMRKSLKPHGFTAAFIIMGGDLSSGATDHREGVSLSLRKIYRTHLNRTYIISAAADSPVADCPALRVEVDANLNNGQTRESKLRGVVLEVYLLHCSLGGHVQF